MADLTPPLKPSRSYGFLSLAVLAIGAIIALIAAWAALEAVERTSQTAVEHALFLSGEDWAEVEVNGLQVILSGDAPSEAARFAALSAAAHEVDGARVIDQMVLPESIAIEPPKFTVEMLRNEAGISLIGLIPAETDREALAQRMRAIDPFRPVSDFLETAEFPTPEGWQNALDFSLVVAGMLPRSKISMDADHVAVEAIAASPDEKREWEQAIRRKRPAGLRLALDIRAPLDVISPYIVRFLSDEKGARFDACTAYTPADRNKIVSAGIAAGVKGAVDCTIGLGVPSPDWPDAVARGIQAVRDMGGGSLTFSDADITLIAPADTPQDTFDRVTGELEADLPEVFSLHAVLPEPETGPVAPAGPPEFIATLGDDGAVQLRGRVASEQDRTIAETLARARFGTRKVYAPLRLDPALPATWAVRTLAGLEALDRLAQGQVVVRPDVVAVTGTTGDKQASAEISRLLSEKLGEAEDFRVNVKYEEALDPVAAMPTPQECVADVNAALAKNKITFAPGSAEIERASLSTVDRIAEILKTCPDVAMEIAGYTDSQGREEMNQALSQRRAEAVVSALLARRVLTTNLTAFGYGEDNPIADNDTDEGREANRRIEFSLIGEDLPRAEVAQGDAPTIRAPARPAAEGAVGDEGSGAGEPVTEDGTEDGAETDPAPQGDAGEAAPDGAAAPVPEAPDAAGNGDDGAQQDTAGTEVDPAADTAVAVEAPVAEAADGTDAATPGAGTAAEAGEATLEETGAIEVEDAAAAPDSEGATAATAGNDPAGDISADVEAADPAGAVAVQESAADLAGNPAGDAEAGGNPPATDPPATDPAQGEPAVSEAAAPDPTVDDGDTAAATEVPGAAEDVAATGSDAAQAATGLANDLSATEATGATEAPAAPGSAAGTEATEAPRPDVTGPTEGADVAGAEAAGAIETPVDVETPEAGAVAAEVEAADAGVDADPDTDPASADAVPAIGDPAAAAGTAVSLDIPAIRPRPRPPFVVDPDLEGIRPRPRPATIPAAPTTE